jgi:cytochrome c556
MRHTILSTTLTLVISAGLSAPIAAEPSAEDAYEYRESIMTALKGHAGAISRQARGLAGDSDYVANHAKAIANLGAELHTIFVEGSNIEGSEAMQAIWDEPEKFAEALANAEEAMAALGDVADGGDMEAIGNAFMNVGKACKGCHDSFREEHEHEH